MNDHPDVRSATFDDIDGIVGLCRLLHAENGTHSMNEPKVRAHIGAVLSGSARGVVGVIGPRDDLKGALLLMLDAIWFSDEFQLVELFNFVREDARRSDYAKQMIKFAKTCAEGTGLDLMIGVLSDKRMETKVKLYGRMLPKRGEFFVHRPATYGVNHGV